MIWLVISLGAAGAVLFLLKSRKKIKKILAQRRAEAEMREREENARLKAAAERARRIRLDKITAIKLKGGLLAAELGRGTLSDERLNMLFVAATQNDIRFDLQADENRRVVPFPTPNMDLVPVNDISQILDIPPSQMMLDDEIFYHQLVTQNLLHPEYSAVEEMRKRLYILLDVSPSMWDAEHREFYMPDGNMRDTWARGVVAGLLADAINDQAQYTLRPFASTVFQKHAAENPDEARKLLAWISDSCDRGGGTDIGHAVKKAVSDIKKLQSTDARMNNILLITDGEDQAGLTRDELVKSLGESIKLHVVLIGTTCDATAPLAPYVIAKF